MPEIPSPQPSQPESPIALLERSLHPHLDRVAVLHENPHDLNSVFGGWDKVEDDALESATMQSLGRSPNAFGHYVIERATTETTDKHLAIPGSAEKRQALDLMSAAVKVASVVHGERNDDGHDVDWRQASSMLIGQGGAATEGWLRRAFLTSAAVAIQFDNDDASRISFIRQVYEGGLAADMAAACELSPLVVIHDEPGSKTIGRYTSVASLAGAFRLPRDKMERYLGLVEQSHDKTPAMTAKAAQRLVGEQVQAGSVDEETREIARQVSTASEKVGDVHADMHKIERFALEQHFIHNQMEAVVGADLTDMPFTRELQHMRTQTDAVRMPDVVIAGWNSPTRKVLLQNLAGDITAAFERLSQPVIERYQTDRQPADGYAGLTEEQGAAVRFREIAEETAAFAAAGRFINLRRFIDRTQRDFASDQVDGTMRVYDLAKDGAAVPVVCEEVIDKVLNFAEAAKELNPTPEELRRILHENRRQMLALATYHIADASDFDEKVRTVPGRLTRDETGQLQLEANLRAVPKNTQDIYAAIALGCPALREIHEGRSTMSQSEKMALGSSNYIDHVLAAVINEAYERKLLDLSKYPRPAETPEPALAGHS